MPDQTLHQRSSTSQGSVPNPDVVPSSELMRIFDDELGSVVRTLSLNQPVYRNLKDVSAMIGGEYGRRVVYELLQNAHDAQPLGNGQVLVSLIVNSPEDGYLLVANGGKGFTIDNLNAIRNIASSTKEVGEGIGNKGVGFRSVSALTDDPRIYSCLGAAKPADMFDGYSFRFASEKEVEERASHLGHANVAKAVSSSMPRFLGAVPVEAQPAMIKALAREGYASVISLHLTSADTIKQAIGQLQEITNTEAPVLLFLERIAKLEIRTIGVGAMRPTLILTRRALPLALEVVGNRTSNFEIVTLGPDRDRWIMARRKLDLDKVRDAVRRSIATDHHLKNWLNWRGDATVSCAVPLDGEGLETGRLYNFLPMSADSGAPLKGHLDAPFYTSINRERARQDLPLNAFLLDMAAQVCAETALAIRSKGELHPRCAVDFAAWNSLEAARIRAAFAQIGTNLLLAQVWPTTAGRWQSFGEVFSWPEGAFKVFTASRATKAGAQNIVSNKLSVNRLDQIDALARAFGYTCKPSPQVLADWAEIVVQILPLTSKDDRWGKLYSDLVMAFPPNQLSALAGKAILLDRKGSLVPAGQDVYVRHESGKRRKADAAPLPPAELARKLTILADDIVVRDSAHPFEKAKLWQSYDATEILGNLSSLFTERQADARREAALRWAFQVWRHDPTGAARALSTADLHVPARRGWIPAHGAAFSQSWTETGTDLDYFLAEAGAISKECTEAASSLLTDIAEWPGFALGTRVEWIRFLTAAGVFDGLVPIRAEVPKGPLPGAHWAYHLRRGTYSDLNAEWHAAARVVEPSHPQTSYWRVGEAWKFPGQAVAGKLSDAARLRFALLAIRHLQVHGMTYGKFSLSRTEREPQYRNTVSSFTPLATFLIASPWFPMEVGDKLTFVSISEGWLLTERRNQPKFVPQAPEEVVALLSKDDNLVTTLSNDPFHLKVWKQKNSAPYRLQVLAEVCGSVGQAERATFRKQHESAWKDLIELDLDLIEGTDLICERPGSFEKVIGGKQPVPIYLRETASAELARLLIDTGSSVLAAHFDQLPPTLHAKIDALATFTALRVEDAQVKVLVDDVAFSPGGTSELLLDVVPWLAEALLVAHDFSADGFEARISVPQVLERLRRLRFRQVETLQLLSQDGATSKKSRFLHRDESRPTLLAVDSLDGRQLVESIKIISSYLHPNLHSLENLIVRLAFYTRGDQDFSTFFPSEAQYAAAAQVPIESVQDLLVQLRHDDSSRVSALLPLLAYYVGRDAAQAMGGRLQDVGVSKWLGVLVGVMPEAIVKPLLAAIEETFDLFGLMRRLGLDYERLNRASMSLGRPSMTSDADLRRQFEVFKSELRLTILDRLRGHFTPLFADLVRFKPYSSLRSLSFILFDEDWCISRPVLVREDVQVIAERALQSNNILQSALKLPKLEALQIANRKKVIEVVERAMVIFEAKGIRTLDEIWLRGPLEIAALLDRLGLLDFHVVAEEEVPRFMVRAGIWPADVPASLEPTEHGLGAEDMSRERTRLLEQQAEERRKRNVITVGDREFDTTHPLFAATFAESLLDAFSKTDWLSRSKRRMANLIEQLPHARVEGGGGGGRSKPSQRPPESVRGAIGLAGELVAFEWLKHKHPNHFNEYSWVSENRTSRFAEQGSMSWGFDFRVQTSEREWQYEVKATPGELCEFELTDGEYRAAVKAEPDKGTRYRILFVFHAFDPLKFRIVELPNPASKENAAFFRTIGSGSTRMRFEIDENRKQ